MNELELLREFHAAAAAPMVALYALHDPHCELMGAYGRCGCGGLQREARIEAAVLALKKFSNPDPEASE